MFCTQKAGVRSFTEVVLFQQGHGWKGLSWGGGGEGKGRHDSDAGLGEWTSEAGGCHGRQG